MGAETAADGRPLIDPIVEYSHREVGIAVVGGYAYRGMALPDLRGQYVFADFSADWTTNAPDPTGFRPMALTPILAAAAGTVARAIMHAALAATSAGPMISYRDRFPSAVRGG